MGADSNVRLQRSRRPARWLALLALGFLAGCAVSFPRPAAECCEQSEAWSGDALFQRTLDAHGYANLDALTDLNMALDGRWKFLITRIQPLVTDHRYRVRSQERIDPKRGIYAASYQGPAGEKQVFRSRSETRVWYDGVASFDEDVLASTALTADSFLLFALGPLSPLAMPEGEGSTYQRLPDVTEKGRRYHRIWRELRPGLGRSSRDELVLWIDAQTLRTYRLHITLEGYRTTRGAHVDVTYLAYRERAGLLFPVRFSERVRGPIAIKAHDWHWTGLDLNRGWDPQALRRYPWTGLATAPAGNLDADP